MKKWLGLLEEESIIKIDFHYLNGQLYLDCYVNSSVSFDKKTCHHLALDLAQVKNITFYQKI